MKKKLIIAGVLTATAIALVVTTVFVTIAFLTSSSGVSNVFTIGDVSITMFEHKVNNKGKLVLDNNGKPIEVDTNSYHLVPGGEYIKNPTIRITTSNDSDEMFLFVKSTNMIRTIEAGNQENAPAGTAATMREQMIANGWVEYIHSNDDVEIVWIYGTRAADGTITATPLDRTDKQFENSTPGEFKLCDKFTIYEKADVSVYGAARVDFTAYAIQVSGNENVYEAWTTIKNTFPFEGGINNPKNPYDPDVGAYDKVPVTTEP